MPTHGIRIGIILSTGFCHLLQDAFRALQDPAVKSRWNIGDRTGLVMSVHSYYIALDKYRIGQFVFRLCSLLSIFLIECTPSVICGCFSWH